MRIALATDAWHPQVNGVVRTLNRVIVELEAQGHEVLTLHPGFFRTVAAPRYPEIRLSLLPGRRIAEMLEAFDPQAIHVATEGPIGMAVRARCLRRGVPFTTSYHTQFPHYIRRYFGVPEAVTWRFVRRFHAPAQRTLAPTAGVVEALRAHGVVRAVPWCRGVDTALFRPVSPARKDLERPVFLYAGRVAVEKNIEAFLSAPLPGTKMVVGDGPARASLERRFPGVVWAGYRFGEELAAHYACGDVFVFPSRTDTFGIVMLEANACGLPVAAHPVTGPIDVVVPGVSGALDEDLRTAALRALEVPRATCIEYARGHSWRRCAEMFLAALAPIGAASPPEASSLAAAPVAISGSAAP